MCLTVKAYACSVTDQPPPLKEKVLHIVVGEVVQWLKAFADKCEGQSSNPRHPHKKAGIAMCTSVTLCLGGMGAGE